MRDGASVVEYDADGYRTILREGTNSLVCEPDDPDTDGFRVACYHKNRIARLNFERQLAATGTSAQEVFQARSTKVDAGELPLVGSAGMFPEYNRRAGRTFSLEDRIVGCFYRGQNSVRGMDNGGLEAARAGATPAPSPVDASNTDHDEPMLPDEESDEVVALAAYLQYLSEGYTPGEDPPWRGKNRIPQDNRLAIGDLNPQRGEEIYEESCANCHGSDGQGVQVGDKKPGPLLGPDSWNDGAGFTRFYQLAGFVRFAMPYMDPGALGDADAQHVAAFIISKPRPSYRYKDEDYQVEPLPIDAAFYRLGDDADGSGAGRQPQ